MKDDIFTPLNNRMRELVDIFSSVGLHIYDITPTEPKRIRELEIYHWLENKDIESFVVLDDDPYELQSFVDRELIKTSILPNSDMIKNMDDCTGLLESHVDRAIQILNDTTKTMKFKPIN